jgi:hypothetical protein
MTALRFWRSLGAPTIIGSALALVMACERSNTPATRGTAATATPGGTTTGATSAAVDSSWNNAIGPVLLVQGEDGNEALVIPPREDDSAAIGIFTALGARHSTVTLFGRGGELLTAELDATAKTENAECRLWPLRAVHGPETGSGWAVGFTGGTITPMPLDSVERLSSRDSMALAAEASRLASNVTAPTAPSFQGLRFTAHDIRRFEVSPGVQAIVAHLIRRVNQEASPLEEQTLLIAERDSGVTTGPYQLAYAERANGMEEEVPTPEVIGGVHIQNRPTLVIARDSDTGVAYSMLERTAQRRWRVRWTSGPQRCE